MGQCLCMTNRSSSQLAVDPNAEIAHHLSTKGKLDKRTHKLLLLGAGSSGKSTLMKQMQYLYVHNRGYPNKEKEKYTAIVFQNIISILTQLCIQSRKYDFTNDVENFEYIQNLITADVTMLNFSEKMKFGLKCIWNDHGIKQAWEMRDEFLIMDNAHYFLSCMSRILSDDYVPSFPDVLYTRSVTTGIINQPFIFENNESQSEFYEIVDVGGQKTERKKWINCFDNVVAILFVIALSGYDQMLWEDDKYNRMADALLLLQDLVHTPAVDKAQFIIFLNKYDLFQNKIGRVPFQPEQYTGDPHDPQQAIAWIKCKVRDMSPEKTFYFQVTCATDSEDINRVFLFCRDIIIKRALKKSGMLL